MISRTLADAVVVLHLAFILFVCLGSIVVFRWPKVAWVHIPAAVWGALIEFAGWICPLTPLENRLRATAGESGYSGGFIEHYVLPVIYPSDLTREMQLGFGAAVIAINVLFYGALIVRRRRRRR